MMLISEMSDSRYCFGEHEITRFNFVIAGRFGDLALGDLDFWRALSFKIQPFMSLTIA